MLRRHEAIKIRLDLKEEKKLIMSILSSLTKAKESHLQFSVTEQIWWSMVLHSLSCPAHQGCCCTDGMSSSDLQMQVKS